MIKLSCSACIPSLSSRSPALQSLQAVLSGHTFLVFSHGLLSLRFINPLCSLQAADTLFIIIAPPVISVLCSIKRHVIVSRYH
jgi:hypothetical protein